MRKLMRWTSQRAIDRKRYAGNLRHPTAIGEIRRNLEGLDQAIPSSNGRDLKLMA
jgi:hypothetical protein